MTFLTVVGALTITGALIWLSLFYLATWLYSDESIGFAFKYYPVEPTLTAIAGLVLLAGWVFWIHFLIAHITIGFAWQTK